MKKFTIIFLAFLVFASCSKTIVAELPETTLNEVPALEQPLSEINIPIKIDLKPYFKAADKDLPKKFTGREQNCEGTSFSYTFYREPIDFQCKWDKLYYEIEGKYSLNLNYCPECTSLLDEKGACVIPRIYASCGVDEPMRKVRIGYSTVFDINSNFEFETKTTLKKAEAIDPCKITVFSYNATDKVLDEVKKSLVKLEKDIDQQISTVDIKSKVKSIWDELNKPMAILNYGYFAIQPEKIGLSKIYFKDDFAYVNLSLGARPQFVSNPSLVVVKPLPKLTQETKKEGFDIVLDVKADYDSISKVISSELSNKELELQKNKIKIDSVRIQSTNGQALNLKVSFSGDKKGDFYLNAFPKFDTTSQVLSFTNVSFDIKSKNALLKAAKWMFNDKITKLIEEKAIVDLKPNLTFLVEMVEKQINQEITKGVVMSGKIEALKVQGIYPGSEILHIRILSSGNLSIKL